LSFLILASASKVSLLFECATDGLKARSCACHGKAEKAVAALAGQVLSMTSAVKFFQFCIWKTYILGNARKQRQYRLWKYSRPFYDGFFPKHHYQSGVVAFVPAPPHLAPGVRRCRPIVHRLGGIISVLWAIIFELPSLTTRLNTGAHQCSQCFPQLCGGDFSPKLPYLSNDVDSAPIQPHLAPGARR
jgi:hypothetical protein